LADNGGFSISVAPIHLPYYSNPYFPQEPTFIATDGSAIVKTSGLMLAYAGNYSMRIYDGLELQESIDNSGYVITITNGYVARYAASSSNFASFVKRNDSEITGLLCCHACSVLRSNSPTGVSAKSHFIHDCILASCAHQACRLWPGQSSC
jgi:hypothetical protein